MNIENVFLFEHAAKLNERLCHILFGNSVVRKTSKNKEQMKDAVTFEIMQAFKELDVDITDKLMEGVN